MNENTVTSSQVTNLIEQEQYHNFPGTTQTVCCLTLTNGFTVLGSDACVDPSNFDKALGERYAREDAVRNIYGYEAYLMRQRIHEQASE